MVLIRSFLFDLFVCLWGMLIPIFYFAAFITRDSKLADRGAKNWARFVIWVLDKMCGITYEVRGLENLPKDKGFVVACKHQSMWETIVMHLVFNRPAYAWKKELLKIPFYGWFLGVMSGITIDRKGGAKALKYLLTQSKKYLDNKQAIILFPQGTRTPIGVSAQDYPYQPGIAALYSALDATVIPAALNSGLFWSKKEIRKKPGKIILEFLPPIKPDLSKKEFMAELKNAIETKSEELKREGMRNE